MKILHIAYSLGESSAATRLAEHQIEKHEVYFFLGRLSKYKFVRDRQIYSNISSFIGISLHVFEIILCKLCGVAKDEIFSFGLNSSLQKFILRYVIHQFKFDVVHLHWGGYGFFPISAFEGLTSIKIITAHDYNSFTGGCHVPMGCEQLQKNCNNCPLLSNKLMGSIASYGLRKRVSSMQKSKLKVTAPSNYTKSVINKINKNLDVRVIPNVLGVQYPTNKSDVDMMLNLYKNKEQDGYIKLIVVGVANSVRDNKGANVLNYVISHLLKDEKRIKVMVVGSRIEGIDPSVYEFYGNIESSKLACLYAIADICLVPSRYETFSQVTLESIACCTPVVAFDLTGPKDIIKNGKSGFLIPAFNVEQYYQVVKAQLSYKQKNLVQLRECALKVIEQYSGKEVAEAFDRVYFENN